MSSTRLLNGEFLLLDKLGQGAFGEVYRAHDVALEVDRAIKILRRDAPGTGSTQFDLARQRFELEAQLGAQLEQRRAARCVRVYGFRKEADSLYLIMEYMPGGSLADRLKHGTLSIQETIHLAHAAALGLSELHALKAVHRDIKPGNILLDAEGHAYVADFGLAQLPRGMSLGSLGSAGELRLQPGTPEYMSPEQSRHEQFLTSASDVFSLGAVLFEALTGEQYRTLRPGTRAIEHRSEVPVWLDELIARMLASAPEARPFGGQELVQILEAKIHEAVALQGANAHRQRVVELSNEAKRHMAERNWVAAVTSLRAWLALEPSPEAQGMLKPAEQALAREHRLAELLASATLAAGERRWADAQSALRDVLALDPANRDAVGLMATVNSELGEIQRVRALADRARNAAGKRRWREAQQAARAWLAAEPGNGEAVKIEREATEALAGSSQRPPAKMAGFAIVGLVCLGIAVVAAVANGSPAPGYAPTREFIAQTLAPTQSKETPTVMASATAFPPTSANAPEPTPTVLPPTATSTPFPTATSTPRPSPIPPTKAPSTPVPTNAPSSSINVNDPEIVLLAGTSGRVKFFDGQGASGKTIVLEQYGSAPVYGATTKTDSNGAYSMSYSANLAVCGTVQGKRDKNGKAIPWCYLLALCVEGGGCNKVMNPSVIAILPDITVDREFPILSPANGSRVGGSATLAWQAYPGASSYSVVCNKIPGNPEEVYRGTATSASIASFSATSGTSFGCSVHALDAAQDRIAVASVTLIRE